MSIKIFNLLVLILFWMLPINIFAQNFSLRGVVISENTNPISGASLFINDIKWAISDELGEFEILELSSGEYEILVSRVGYESKKVSISLPSETNVELQISLKEKIYDSNPIVITANRRSKLLQEVSVPATVIDGDEIRTSGALRLNEILDEQIGLNIISDHGTGIQVQGFDPEYTLILIDNQPVIGRVAGTLDLTRLAVGNVEQIEIVKGPSSALWGSSALAGVVNIITDKGNKPFNMNYTGRYGSTKLLDGKLMDGGVNLTLKQDKLRGRFYTNYNQSSGFDLDATSLAPTVPEFDNLTITTGINYRISSAIDLGISARYFKENQFSLDEVGADTVTNEQTQKDFSISPEITINMDDKILIEANAFISGFESNTISKFKKTGVTNYTLPFEQTLNKFESQISSFWNKNNTTIAGIGMNREDLTSDRYTDVPVFDSYFAFLQHEIQFSNDLSITAGFRFDDHSEYQSQVSPKFSILYKMDQRINFRASLGSGFKAPDFRQLFLTFTNPTAGYSVYGTSTVVDGIQQLEEDGQIAEILISTDKITNINAEQSFAYNAGFDLFPISDVQITLNAFRNNVTDLIDAQRVALKTNGSYVYSYFNLNKVYTQGIETEVKYTPAFFNSSNISLGYQFLDARKKIIETSDQVVNGQVITVSKDIYIPLYNRSKHTFNARIYNNFKNIGLKMNARIIIRGSYWFADYNADNREGSDDPEDPNEYALDDPNFFKHSIINYTLTKSFGTRYQLQFGIKDVLNVDNKKAFPSNPGRTFFTQVNINLF